MAAATAPKPLPDMGEEDCSYILRELELSAFSQLVTAFRAQGSFNKFKETVLEGVKTALFISDENYKAELRKAANDDFLMKVCSVLNPSYDTYADWAAVSLDVEEDCRIIPQPRYFDGSSTHAVADSLLQMANAHNENVEDMDIAMAAILQLPKVPYVPERLRLLLRDTESLHTDRILPPRIVDDFVEPALPAAVGAASDGGKKTPKATPVRRRRKSKANGLKDSLESPDGAHSPDKQQPSTSGSSGPPQLSPQKTSSEAQAAALLGLLPSSKDAETMGVKEFINKIQMQIEQEQRTAVNDGGQRRKRKPRQTAAQTDLLQKEGYQECARCRPFVFPRYASDGTKPPRGNPDRAPSSSRRSSNPPSNPQTPAPPANPTMAPPPVPPVAPGTLQQPQVTGPIVVPSPAAPSTSTQDAELMPAPIVTPKENTILAVRRLPSPSSSVPSIQMSNMVVSKPSTSSTPQVTPVSSPGIYKRARVASFNEGLTSPNDQRAVLKTRAPFLQTTPLAKVKVAMAAGADQQPPQAPGVGGTPTTPSRTFYATGLSVASVNRVPVPMRSSSVGSAPHNAMGGGVPSTSGGGGISQSQTEVIDFGVSPRPVFKRNVYKAPASVPTVRLANGTTLSVAKSTSPHIGGGSSPVTVVMKKSTPPPGIQGGAPTASGSPSGFVIHRPSPPPSAFGSASSSNSVQIIRKFVATNSLPPNSPNQQMSVGQFLRKSSSSTSSPTSALPDQSIGPPPPKRLIYCEPSSSNAVITTVDYEIPLTSQTDAVFQPAGTFDAKYGNTPTKEYPGSSSGLSDFGLDFIGDARQPSPPPPPNQVPTGPPPTMMNHGFEVIPRSAVFKPLHSSSDSLQDHIHNAAGLQKAQQYPPAVTSSDQAPYPAPEDEDPPRKPPVPDILQQSMMEIS